MKLNLIVGLFVLSISSCGSKTSDESSAPEKPSGPGFSLVGLNGTDWESECKVECNQNCSRKRQLHLEEYTYRYDIFTYDGLECLENLKKITHSEHYINVTKSSKEKLAGWISFAAVTDKVLATSHQEVMTMSFNQNSRFGFNNWVTDEAKDVAGRKYDKDSEAEHAKGKGWERTMKVDGDTVYLAKYVNNAPTSEVSMSFKKTGNTP